MDEGQQAIIGPSAGSLENYRGRQQHVSNGVGSLHRI